MGAEPQEFMIVFGNLLDIFVVSQLAFKKSADSKACTFLAKTNLRSIASVIQAIADVDAIHRALQAVVGIEIGLFMLGNVEGTENTTLYAVLFA